ncbi:MAG: DUF4359 domain-containing protein [Hydrococcus sp. C42_A2020_068]|nr:DUF4359 domain-containing protein [Hydrococcus sp. C42_A2020_068]
MFDFKRTKTELIWKSAIVTIASMTMKIGQRLMWVGRVAIVGMGGLLVVTNPSNQAYEQYATERLTLYLKEEGCTQVSEKLDGIVQSFCKSLVDTARPQIKQLIAQQTKRHNYLLFSIYQTKLSPPAPAPGYYFETIGALENFYTYQVEEL